MTTKNTKVYERGWAYAGSQLQIQIYVNRRSEKLFQKIIEELPDLALLHARLNWVSPLEKDRFAEYQDTGGLRLKLCHYADQRISLDPDDGMKVNYEKFGDPLTEVKAVTGKKERMKHGLH